MSKSRFYYMRIMNSDYSYLQQNEKFQYLYERSITGCAAAIITCVNTDQ